MNAIRRYNMSKEEKRALTHEVARQAREITNKFALELDATILYAVREVSEKHGKPWGKNMLRELYDTVAQAREDLVKKYEMEDDAEFILLRTLKEIGVDLEQWSKEQKNPLVIHIE